MKLRFAVNQGESLRRGIDAPSSTWTLQVHACQLSVELRNLIADRMKYGDIGVYRFGTGDLLMANEPTLKGLEEAVRKDDAGRPLVFLPAKGATP